MSLSTFRHGVYYSESSTETTPEVQYGQIPVYIGIAPVNLATKPAEPNKPVLISSLSEFKEKFGYTEDFTYTLCEAACYHFKEAEIAPILCINVLDGSKSKFLDTAQTAIVQKDGSLFTLAVKGIIQSSVTIKGIANYTAGDETNKIQLADAIELNASAEVGKFIYQGYDIVDSATTGYEEVVSTTPSEGEISLEDAQAKNSNATVGDFIAIEQSYLLSATSVTGSKEIIANHTALTESDYMLSFDGEGNLVITPESDGNITSAMNALEVTYSKIKPSAVTSTDIIGTVDTSTGNRTGLQAIDYILGEIGQPPGMLLAPGFSHIPVVCQAFIEKAQEVSGNFPALVVADIDSSAEGSPYSGTVKTWKDNNGYSFVDLVICYPMAKVNDKVFHMSTIVAATKQATLKEDSAFGTPCESPSNRKTSITSLVNMKGEEIYIDKTTANFLNHDGVVTALKKAFDFVVWGNNTSVFPEDQDPKNCWISTRSLYHYMVNVVIMTHWAKIDARSTDIQIQNVEDSVNNWMNSMANNNILKEGSCSYKGSYNVATENRVKYKINWADYKPAQSYDFDFEFNSNAYD